MFDPTINATNIDSAIHDPDLLLTATSLLPEDDVKKPLKLRTCGDLFLKRFRSSRNKDDIDSSVKAFERARQLGSTDIHFLDFEYDYATALLERHNLTHDLADLNLSISSLENVVKGTTHESTELAHRLGFLSSLFLIRFKSTNDLADISKAIETLQLAINVTPNSDANLPNRLNNVAIFLRRRFKSTGNLADISDAILAQQKLVDLMPEDNPDMPGWLDDLVFSLECRFRHTVDLDDITNALSILSKAIDLTPDAHTDTARRLSRRGILFRMKFQRTGDSADISNAIKDQEKAISLIPDSDDHQIHQLFGNLGSSYLCLFDQTGDLEDISKAITALERAVRFIPEDDPNSGINWGNFGNALIRRFECTGDLSDISDSIHAQQKAIGLTPEDHDNLPSLLNNLGLSFQTRFDVTGDLIDISEAIAAHEKSIHLTPEGHASMSAHLNNLGTSFQCRSQRTGDITDISEAIDAHRKAVRLCPKGHPSMATLLSNLGNSLYGRFKSTNNIADISEAILSHQEAVGLTSEKHPTMAGRLGNLSIALKNRFGLSGNMEDIDTAISVAERAVELIPKDEPSIPSQLNNLAIAFHTRFQRTENLTDISEAILRQERAIHLTPANHGNLPGLIKNLGLFLEDRFELMGDPTDIKGAVATYKLAASSITGPPSDRLRAAINWATASKRMQDQSESLDAYKTAIELVSQVAGMEYTIGLRHRILVDTPDLSNAAAATAFALGKPKTALEWLEQGRCLVWNQLNNLHTPLDDLASFDHDLADDLSRVSQALENAGLRNESVPIGTDADIMVEKMALQDEATSSVKLAREWDQLLQKIRDIPKFKNFLRPTQYCDLIERLPKAGPVVIINVHEDRCDAVVLVAGTDDPPHIHLDQFSYKTAVRLLQLLRSHLSGRGGRVVEESDELEPVNDTRALVPFVMFGETMQDVLRELWLGVVKPILNALDILASFFSLLLLHICLLSVVYTASWTSWTSVRFITHLVVSNWPSCLPSNSRSRDLWRSSWRLYLRLRSFFLHSYCELFPRKDKSITFDRARKQSLSDCPAKRTWPSFPSRNKKRIEDDPGEIQRGKHSIP